MNSLLTVLSLLDLLYSSSPLADCKATKNEVLMGKWEAAPADPSMEDHGITGSQPVYAIDVETLHIRKFVYHGTCDFARFRLSNASDGTNGVEFGYRLGQYNRRDIILRLPSMLSSFRYLGVWCREKKRVYAFVKMPQDIKNVPRTVEIGKFQNTNHGVKGSVEILDGRTIKISGFSYDGKAPNATFAVGQIKNLEVTEPTLVPILGTDTTDDHYGPLPAFENAVLHVKILYGKNVCHYKWFGVYGHKLNRSLGHLMMPRDLYVPADHEQNDIYWTTTTTTTMMSSMSTLSESAVSGEAGTTTTTSTTTTPAIATKEKTIGNNTSRTSRATTPESRQLTTTLPMANVGKKEASYEMLLAIMLIV